MESKDISIYVPQDLVRDQACSNFDITVWFAVAILANHLSIEGILVDAAAVAYQIKNSAGYTRNMTSDVAESLRTLIEFGYLNGQRADNKHYEILRSTYDFSNYKYHVKISVEDFRRIMRAYTRPYTLLRYYLLFLSTINYQTKCSFWSNESLAEILNNSTTTVSNCFVALEKMHLIYIYRGMNISNTYGRYEDKDEIIAFGKSRSDGSRHISLRSSIKRRMTQMYNQVKKGRKYDDTTMAELFEYCQNVNDQEMEMAENQTGYEPNFYDLSIFSVDFARDAS